MAEKIQKKFPGKSFLYRKADEKTRKLFFITRKSGIKTKTNNAEQKAIFLLRFKTIIVNTIKSTMLPGKIIKLK